MSAPAWTPAELAVLRAVAAQPTRHLGLPPHQLILRGREVFVSRHTHGTHSSRLRELTIAAGAVSVNLSVAMAYLGWKPEVVLLPCLRRRTYLAAVVPVIPSPTTPTARRRHQLIVHLHQNSTSAPWPSTARHLGVSAATVRADTGVTIHQLGRQGLTMLAGGMPGGPVPTSANDAASEMTFTAPCRATLRSRVLVVATEDTAEIDLLRAGKTTQRLMLAAADNCATPWAVHLPRGARETLGLAGHPQALVCVAETAPIPVQRRASTRSASQATD